MAVQYYEGIGRRKEATARVRVMSGSGKFIVNEKPLDNYFPRVGDMQLILAPLQSAGENLESLDVTVIVKGGGVTGQTSAVQLGVARALVKMNPDLRPTMRKGASTRDASKSARNPASSELARPDLHRVNLLVGSIGGLSGSVLSEVRRQPRILQRVAKRVRVAL
jgi:small subunit ribosomal protein S9